MKILLYDCETTPSWAYIWHCWQDNIPINMIGDSGELLCWCAKWLGERKVMHGAAWEKGGIEQCIRGLHELIEEADAVVAHNGASFDAKVMNTMFLKYNFDPPSPAKMIDTLQVARSKFKLLSNKLDFLGQYLEEGRKIDTGGFELWLNVMQGNSKAQKKMLTYNRRDVLLLERIYLRLRPWITNHPNAGVLNDENADSPVCTNCGSRDVVKKGTSATKQGIYKRYKCNACGTPLRGRYTQIKKNENILTQEV